MPLTPMTPPMATSGRGRGTRGGTPVMPTPTTTYKPLTPPPSMPSAYMKKGGKVGSASKRADGIAQKGKTKGTQVKMCGGGMMK